MNEERKWLRKLAMKAYNERKYFQSYLEEYEIDDEIGLLGELSEQIDLLGDYSGRTENQITGDHGERYVEQLLQKMDYETVLTKNSLTAVDVWGYREYDDAQHIMQIQVKTKKVKKGLSKKIENNLKPKYLNEDDIKRLHKWREFTEELYSEFKEEGLTLSDKTMIVSNGYAGVLWKKWAYKKIYNPHMISISKNADKKQKQNIERLHAKELILLSRECTI